MRLAETRHNCFRRVGELDCRFLPSANWRLAEAAEHRAIRCKHGGTEHDQADVRREQTKCSFGVGVNPGVERLWPTLRRRG